MNPTLSEIGIAIILVAVIAALFVWFQRSLVAASARRMMGMIARIGIDPGIAAAGDAHTKAIMKETRRRCRNCPYEDLCERWLAGEVEGGNSFCPNARTFGFLAGPSGRTA